jgi:hypothetical protein
VRHRGARSAGAGLLEQIKSVEPLNPIFEAQLLTYMRLTGKRIGLLMNFNSRLLKEGVKRLALERRTGSAGRRSDKQNIASRAT